MSLNINCEGRVCVFHIPKLLVKHKHKSDFQSFWERGFKPEEMVREAAFLQVLHHLGQQLCLPQRRLILCTMLGDGFFWCLPVELFFPVQNNKHSQQEWLDPEHHRTLDTDWNQINILISHCFISDCSATLARWLSWPSKHSLKNKISGKKTLNF